METSSLGNGGRNVVVATTSSAVKGEPCGNESIESRATSAAKMSPSWKIFVSMCPPTLSTASGLSTVNRQPEK